MKNILTILCLLCGIHLSYSQTTQAPNFTVTTPTGSTINLYETYLNNDKTVVLELFFDACPSCNSFAPLLGELYKDWGNGTGDVEFIALDVSLRETDDNVTAFQTRHGHTWPGASAEGGSLEAIQPYKDNEFGTYLGTPTIVIIAPDGTVSFNVNSFKRNAEGIALLDAAIAATGAKKSVTASITGVIQNSTQQGVGSVGLKFTGGTEAIVITDETGQFTLPDLPIDQAYTITPEKNIDFSNGVTTFDLVLIRKHILGIEPFDTEVEMIAADANLSNSVTTFDLVLLRRGILGTDTNPPAGSWRFIPAQIELTSLNDLTDLSFLGIKIGDINNSADPANLQSSTPRSSITPFSFLVDNQHIQAGDIVEVPFSITETAALMGFQLTLDFDATVLQFQKIKEHTLTDFGEGNINTDKSKKGLLTMSWFDVQDIAKKDLFTLEFKAKQSGQLKDLLRINSAITPAEAYTQSEEILTLELDIATIKDQLVKFQISPNPTGIGVANISFFANEITPTEVQVWSADGRLIQQLPYLIKEEGLQHLALSTTELNAGIYFIKIWSGERLMESGRVVVK